MSPLGTCTVDSTGLVVTQFAGRNFAPSWVGLPLLINGNQVTIAAVQSAIRLTLKRATTPTTKAVPFAPIRETIYQAFFNLISNIPNVTCFSRSPEVYASVGIEKMPYVFVEQRAEIAGRDGRGIPYNWQFDVCVGLYTYSADPDDCPPVTMLNPILDSLEYILNPSPTTGVLTLDGLVNECRLNGNGMEAAGSIANNAWAYVPARIWTT